MQKDYTKLFNEKYDTALQEALYPSENIKDEFRSWLGLSLLSQTEFTLQCSWATFKALIEKPVNEVFSLLEMCNALNAIEYSTANILGVSLKMYSDIKDAVKQMARTWDEIAAPIKQACNEVVQKEYDADMAAEKAKNSILPAGGTPLPRKSIPFKSGKN